MVECAYYMEDEMDEGFVTVRGVIGDNMFGLFGDIIPGRDKSSFYIRINRHFIIHIREHFALIERDNRIVMVFEEHCCGDIDIVIFNIGVLTLHQPVLPQSGDNLRYYCVRDSDKNADKESRNMDCEVSALHLTHLRVY